MAQIRRGWRGHEEGWWSWISIPGYCNYFRVKVTEGGEEILFGLNDDKSDLQLLDVLQYATHLQIADELPMKFMEVLQTAADPVPALEALEITEISGRAKGRYKVLDAIKSKKLSNLKALELSFAGLRHEDVEILATAFDTGCLPSLKDLNLASNDDIGSGGHIKLAKVMESGRMLALETLSLSETNLGDDGCEAYANAMSSGRLPSLKCINFGKNSIGIRGMEALGRAIESGALKNLTELDLYSNKHLGEDDGGRGHFILAEHMGSGRMRALEKLKLPSTNMGDEGCEAYAKAMISGELPSLSCIEFWENRIGNRGAEALGRTIRSGKLKNLAELHLSWNGITDEGMIALMNSFHEGEASTLPNLRSLDFNKNPFTEVGLRSLAEALKSGRLNSLDQLRLEYSSVRSEEGGAALVSAFSSNIYLTVDVRFEWEDFPALGRRVEQLRKRNQRNKDISAGLKASPKVPAAFGKIYICGDPEVGKTTLRKALPRTRRQSLLMREGRHQVEERTRGIDVSQFSSKETKPGENPITLLVWDMAGQEDYHLVHNAFFPDLSSAEGKATSFVVVCSSKKKGDESKQVDAECWLPQLEYWLKFIASSCGKSTDRRHVFVVLNNFDRESKVWKYEQHWKRGLEILKDDFKDYLDIQTDSFIMDVRKRRSIEPLKTRLLHHSRDLLKDEMVPNICQFIQMNLTDWSKAREQFPVLRWAGFVAKVRSIDPCTEKTLEAATKYLNEAGVLIYIEQEPPSDRNIHNEKLVVLNPSWFCSKIVGNMFFQRDMGNPTDRLFRKRVNQETGSISESEFKKFFKALLGNSNEWSNDDFLDLIAILLWLGVCYKGGDQKLFIPALIDENVNVGEHWDELNSSKHGEDQWVMGFSIEHKRSKLTLAPIALWHKFQVELAQSTKFNARSDNDFVSGKYFMTFNVNYMDVLIKVTGYTGSPTFDGINIFVRPSGKVEDDLDGNRTKQFQVDLANDLTEILLVLWIEVCPGVDYLHRVVWPWPACQSRYSEIRQEVISKRNVEVAEVQKWVREHGLGRYMEWKVGSCRIKEDHLLSRKDKRDVTEKTMKDSSCSGINRHARELNDSLFELYRPEKTPTVQIIFFHGLQLGDYSDAHLSTWQSGDGSGSVWPQTWLVEDIPGAHVLSVSYSGGLRKKPDGSVDMYIIGENLLSDLLLDDIGQVPHCPVVLVGHSIGGLVIKELCYRAHDKLNRSEGSERAKLETFLKNIRGIFYYATPHHGSGVAEILAQKISNPLLSYFETLSKDTARLNYHFDAIHKVHYKDWLTGGLGESIPTNLGPFKAGVVPTKCLLVPEASARGENYNVVEGSDHFSVCRPKSKKRRSFSTLKNFVLQIADAEKI